MPAALPAPLRAEIFRRLRQGQSAAAVAQALSLCPRTVRRLRAAWRGLPPEGTPADPDALAPGYRRCGRRLAPDRPPVRSACADLRRGHPGWGAGRLRLGLLRAHPAAAVPPP